MTVSNPDPYDLGLLREEAQRIKSSIYASYGPEIEALYQQHLQKQTTLLASAEATRDGSDGGAADAGGHPQSSSGETAFANSPSSPAKRWQHEVEALVAAQQPLRESARKCQQDSIERLIAELKASGERGEDVKDRLELLMRMQA